MKGHKNIGNPFPNTIKIFLIFFTMICFILVSCRSGTVDDLEESMASGQETADTAEDIKETGLTDDPGNITDSFKNRNI